MSQLLHRDPSILCKELRSDLNELFSTQRVGVLATSGAGGPYTSLLAFYVPPGFKYILFATKRETQKFYHILNEPRCALLIDSRNQAGEDYQGAMAVTGMGKVSELDTVAEAEIMAKYLAKNPGLKEFCDQPTTAICRLEIEKWLVVDKFQRTRCLDLASLLANVGE